jgi:iron complex outermembrane receptor protein
VLPTGTQSFNAPSGTLRGADVELTWVPHLPTGDLALSGSASFLDAKYGTFLFAPITRPRNPAVAPFGGNVVSAGDASGNHMIKAPELSFNVTADYSFPVARSLMLGTNLTWQHSAKFYWEVDNRLVQPAHDVVNAQIYLGDVERSWTARLWTKNALDERYAIYSTAATFGDAAAYAAPRTYGITLEKRFGGR